MFRQRVGMYFNPGFAVLLLMRFLFNTESGQDCNQDVKIRLRPTGLVQFFAE